MNIGVTEALVKFTSEITFEKLPANVVHETERILLDIIGCALGAAGLDKGRISADLAKDLAGKPEATILGGRDKVASTHAAFANAELMHAMDYDPVLPPGHVSPFVTSAPLALAESRSASGKTLLTALIIAHEVASRIGISLGTFRGKKGGFPPRSFGFGCCEFGAVAGSAKVLGLGQEKIANAFGIAGNFAPLPGHTKWVYTPLTGMIKYGSAGWMAQGGVTSALLAERGYQGDKSILDGDYGFWAMNGSEACMWEKITEKLGKEWMILKTTYKPYPCCGIFSPALDAFTKILLDNDLKPEEIEEVLVKTEGFAGLPRFQSLGLENHVDAQFRMPYNIAVAAHRVKIGPEWQKKGTMENPEILNFMRKVNYETYPRCEEAREQDLVLERRPYIRRRPAYVEVEARGKTFAHQVEYAKWLSMDVEEVRARDEELEDKFKTNASEVLQRDRIEKAIELIWGLERIEDVTELTQVLSS